MTALERPRAAKPAHVPDDRVVEFDFYNLPGVSDDVQLAYRAFQQSAPDIFWTPYNGGHWVATRAEDIEVMQRDYARFSHRKITLPKMEQMPRQVPLEINPPEHTDIRKPLTQALLPKVVNAMEDKVRATAIELIEGFYAKGECEFVHEFAGELPILLFLDMVNLPREDRHYLRPLAEKTTRSSDPVERMTAHQAVNQYIAGIVEKRRAEPGDDLLSPLVNAEVAGERIDPASAVSYATLVLFGGLDTVAAMLGFVARFLALNPSHRRQLVEKLDDTAYLRNAIEELLRRHGIANTAREIADDFEYKGLQFKKGEMILPPNMLVGMDDRVVEDPLKVDFERPFPIKHSTFGNGPHTCPGAVLARRELLVFLQEWLKRIPDYQIKPGTKPVLASGMVSGVLKLELSWTPRAA